MDTCWHFEPRPAGPGCGRCGAPEELHPTEKGISAEDRAGLDEAYARLRQDSGMRLGEFKKPAWSGANSPLNDRRNPAAAPRFAGREEFEESLGRIWDNPPRPMTGAEIDAFYYPACPWWRRAAHRFAHLAGLNRVRPDFRRQGYACDYCGKLTKWRRGGP